LSALLGRFILFQNRLSVFYDLLQGTLNFGIILAWGREGWRMSLPFPNYSTPLYELSIKRNMRQERYHLNPDSYGTRTFILWGKINPTFVETPNNSKDLNQQEEKGRRESF